jgi:hypothetical protein
MRLFVLGMLGALGFAPVACTNTALPTPTEAMCPSPDPMTLTWDSFGQKFMTDYCVACHDSSLVRTQRNGAPIYHDYDTFAGVLSLPEHIDQYAGSGPVAHNTLMPPGRCPSVKGGSLDRDCPKPTDEERTDLSTWLACEKARRAGASAR